MLTEMLNTNDKPGNKKQLRFLKINEKSHDVTDYEGSALVEKLQKLARDNGISKFDIYDSDRKSLSPAEIESGDFKGDLYLKIENLK